MHADAVIKTTEDLDPHPEMDDEEIMIQKQASIKLAAEKKVLKSEPDDTRFR